MFNERIVSFMAAEPPFFGVKLAGSVGLVKGGMVSGGCPPFTIDGRR
jgi:hypothetical protein